MIKGHGEKLSRKQDAFIETLLTVPTILEAAKVIGVTHTTAWRWLKEPSVQDAYRLARREVVQHAITRLQQATGRAVDTLLTIMEDIDSPASARVSAAKAILETAVRAVEIESLEARIATLEGRRNGSTP